MKNGYYLIGEVSKITGISKDTLQFYSKIGLISPDHIDPENKYRYYSRWDLWKLDIISMCQKLGMPLEKIKQVLKSRDNERVLKVLLDYRDEALKLSKYYQDVADDIIWYQEENMQITSEKDYHKVEMKYLNEEIVIAGMERGSGMDYHAKLQEASHGELNQLSTIRRKYGYILNVDSAKNGEIVKKRAYLKVKTAEYDFVQSENLYRIPEGEYAVCIVKVMDEKADFTSLFEWADRNGYDIDEIFADEIGLQLFHYIDPYTCEMKAHLVKKKPE